MTDDSRGGLLSDIKNRLASSGSFFDGQSSLQPVDTDQLPDASHYQAPAVPANFSGRVSSLKSFVSLVEKVARADCQSDFDESKQYLIDYRGELNDAQFRAATKLHGPILVVAGAGSGKTRAIVYRVSFLLENRVKPERILLLTFTRKAAREMLDRVAKLTRNQQSAKVVGGTFHSFASAILRRYGKIVGIQPNFTIIDGSDSADAINLVRTQLGIEKSKKTLFPNKHQLSAIISASRNKDRTINQILDLEHPKFSDHAAAIAQIAKAYEAYKRAANLFDYDDLLEVLRDKLKADEAFRTKVQGLYDFVLVDEYQDTNIIQSQLLKLLAGSHGNIFVVGDDAQSIYAFRGAHFENILRFPKEFPNAAVVLMEDNYRSSQEILDFSNAVINEAYLGYKKHLKSQYSSSVKPQALKFYDEQEEARFIADKIEKQYSQGLKLKDMAVLYRSSYHGNFLQAELLKRNIPFVTVGGIKFIEKKHVKDTLAYLRITVNNNDAIAWSRVLTMLPAVGEVTASKIISQIHSRTFRAIEHADKKYAGQLAELLELLQAVKQTASPKAKLEYIFRYYYPYLDATEEDADIRKLDLAALRKLAMDYQTIEAFINDFSLDPPNQAFQDREIETGETTTDCITLSTVHSAKGLEWQLVFIIHALDGLFPSHRSIQATSDLDEERRLFYVAATRAKEQLFISMPSYSMGYDAYFSLPSRFLVEAARAGQVVDFKVTGSREQRFEPPARSQQADEPRLVPDIVAGDGVNHQLFGRGTVVELEGEVATILFSKGGTKVINLAFAPLEKLS